MTLKQWLYNRCRELKRDLGHRPLQWNQMNIRIAELDYIRQEIDKGEISECSQGRENNLKARINER